MFLIFHGQISFYLRFAFFLLIAILFLSSEVYQVGGGAGKESLNFWVCHMDLLAIYEQVSFIPGCFYSYFIISLH